MKIPRRKFLQLTAGAAGLATASQIATATDYPTRPVHLIIGYPPGGSADMTAPAVHRGKPPGRGH